MIQRLYFLLLCITSVPVVAQHRARVSRAEVTGTFEDIYGSKFRLLALGNNRLRVQFNGIYASNRPDKNGDPGEDYVNTGFAFGIAKIQADTAVLIPNGEEGRCVITLWFRKPGNLQVEQTLIDGTCGFGNNVHAFGGYDKISSRRPRFRKAP